jgi:hypothetical protein
MHVESHRCMQGTKENVNISVRTLGAHCRCADCSTAPVERFSPEVARERGGKITADKQRERERARDRERVREKGLQKRTLIGGCISPGVTFFALVHKSIHACTPGRRDAGCRCAANKLPVRYAITADLPRYKRPHRIHAANLHFQVLPRM